MATRVVLLPQEASSRLLQLRLQHSTSARLRLAKILHSATMTSAARAYAIQTQTLTGSAQLHAPLQHTVRARQLCATWTVQCIAPVLPVTGT